MERHPRQASRVSTGGDKHAGSVHPGFHVMRRAPYLCGLPPQSSYSQPNHEKNIRPNPAGGHSVKYLTSTPRTVQIIEESLRNCHSQKEPKETEGNVTWHPERSPRAERAPSHRNTQADTQVTDYFLEAILEK